MGFEVIRASIFDSSHECLVNTVNTKGAMGKGLALDFRFRVPEMYEEYKDLCNAKQIRIGKYWLYGDPNRLGKRILNFPTKNHYAHPSQLSFIIEGLDYFRQNYASDNIHSIAFPLLGARNGKLKFGDAYGVMHKRLSDLPIDVTIYLGSEKPDKFTSSVMDILTTASDDFLRGNLSFDVEQISRLRENLPRITSFSELLENSIFAYEQVQRIYDFGFSIYEPEKSHIRLNA